MTIDTDPDSWRRASAAELGRAIGAGALDPVALAEAFLAAAGAEDADARVYARMTPERARAEAEAARGRARGGMRRGPLDGVPLSWKDNIDSAGVATEAGSRLLTGRTPREDATVLARGTEAGLVCLGKTHLSELAFSGLGVNPMTATPENALVAGGAPGGSSSGAAVSVARGLAPAGIGSDTGGSVRIPAAWNGLVGLKTTAGRIPNDGVIPLAASLDTVGPLTRTVEDARLLFDMLAGTETPADAAPADAPLQIAETAVWEDADPQVADGVRGALERLAEAGHRVTSAEIPEFAEAYDVAARLSPLVTREAWDHWGDAIEANPGAMYPMIEARFRSGLKIDAAADRAARDEFARLGAAVAARIAEGGPIAFPTVPSLPPAIDALLADEALYVRENLRALRNTRLGNILGLSAITLPVRGTVGGPIGLMLFGAPGDEAGLLAYGARIEAVLGG